ncbi:hypothetical protein [Natronolimnohabitans innermongolicus]|uniref:Uncharacterized protein n=1 Tax=Natronolimnohabitans innermongolicus JCM 12255 TaxID=1227499 RepID=L9WQK3_9EURY|nr:hypothetical protein [Natronolimnohabitans innermongolicus]ELY51672.1 hypothetical protein C493_17121 [Natronolimnohabitans innermongolicus JCM 12255]
MSNDDSRGNESPDRRDEPTPSSAIRTHLEALDKLTHALLEALHDPRTKIDGRTLADHERREASLRCREIRAETSQLGLLLFGTEALIPYHPEGSVDLADAGSGVTVYSGPDPDALRRDQHTDDTQRDQNTNDPEHDQRSDDTKRDTDPNDPERDSSDHTNNLEDAHSENKHPDDDRTDEEGTDD